MFLRCLAEDTDAYSEPRLDALRGEAAEFVEALKLLQEIGESETSVPYRRLIPVRMWRSTVADDAELNKLYETLPEFLAAAGLGNVDPTSLGEWAGLLDRLTRRLDDQARQRLRTLAR